MKKTCAILAVMVLTVSLFTGCGCRNSAPANTSEATMPTMATSAPTTEMTTEATTQPTTAPTEATIEDGNGPISTDSTNTTDTTESGNARSRSGGMMGGAGSGNGITGSIG